MKNIKLTKLFICIIAMFLLIGCNSNRKKDPRNPIPTQIEQPIDLRN